MKRLTGLFTLAVLLMLASSALVFADVALPDQNKKQKNASYKVYMDIRPSEREKEATLMISRDVLRDLQAQLDGADSQNAASLGHFNNQGKTQTLMTGLFLSLAFAFGGVWLVRARKGANGSLKGATLTAVVLALCGASASLVYANAGPPKPPRPLSSRILSQETMPYGAYGQVKVEIIGEGYGIVLDLPKK